MLNFVLDFELPQCDINEPASNTAEGEDDPHWCRGKYVWENNKANIFLNNLKSESVHQQLNSINESLKQVDSNEEIDVSVNSLTNFVEAIAEPFYKNFKGSQNSENVKSNVVYRGECDFKKKKDMLNKFRAEKSDTSNINMV